MLNRVMAFCFATVVVIVWDASVLGQGTGVIHGIVTATLTGSRADQNLFLFDGAHFNCDVP